CIIITGANSGGKTVTLKTVGVCAFLAQIGCFIPASGGSKLPIFNQILTDIGEYQSIENHLSTFTSHLKRLKEILSLCDSGSLVLLDEIGTGTDPIDGLSLAIGVIKSLVRRKVFTLATSHYDGLKKLAFNTHGVQNAGMEFDYQTLQPTFRLVLGVSGNSNAYAIATRFGMPNEILEEMVKARDRNGECEKSMFDLIERERVEVEKLRRSLEEKEQILSGKLLDIASEQKKLEAFRRTRYDEISEEFECHFKLKLKQFEGLIKDLKERAPSTASSSARDLSLARKGVLDLKKAISELEVQPFETSYFPEPFVFSALEIGDSVSWKKISKIGIIESIDRNSNHVDVNFDGIRLNLPLSDVFKVQGQKEPNGQSSTGSNFFPPPQVVRNEIDLRGLRVEEALEKTEIYLKLARSQQLGKVHLIHGKGTGKLKKAIHDFLKSGPFRYDFRLGRYGEGDHGVTVVILFPGADSVEESK
ncbi:Smr/MutS family protein, partial [bacterium]|nr:Smr/MutS family protein [bacterium]